MNGRNGNVVPVHPLPVQGRLEMRKTSASPADGFKSTPAFQEIKSTVEKVFLSCLFKEVFRFYLK